MVSITLMHEPMQKSMRVLVPCALFFHGEDDHEYLLVQVFVHRVRKYLGSYLLQLADCEDVCVVFSAGIGENSPKIRTLTCQHLEVR